MDVFEFAMEKEKYSEDYYRRLAGKSNNKSLETVFNMLADEEAKHYKIVSDMKDDVPADLAETKIPADAKNVFVQMKEGTEKLHKLMKNIESHFKQRNSRITE